LTQSHPKQEKTGVIGRTLRFMLGTLLCWMTYTVASTAPKDLNLTALQMVGGLLIFFVLIHALIMRYRPNLNRWLGALFVAIPLILLFALGGQPGRVASVGYVGIALLLLAVKGNTANEALFIPSLLTGKETHLRCLLFAPIDLIEKHLGGPGGMPG